MEGDSTLPLFFWSKTAVRSLQCGDAHYCGEERTSDLPTFLASHWQYAYTNCPKLEREIWHSLFDLQVHICGELHLCSQKTKSAPSLPLIFKIEIFCRVACSDNTIRTLVLCFRIICKTPALVTSNCRVQKVWVAFDRFSKVISLIKVLFFLFGCQLMRHKPHAKFSFL